MKIKWFGQYGKIGMPGFIAAVVFTIILAIIAIRLFNEFNNELSLRLFGKKTEALVTDKYEKNWDDATDYYIKYRYKGVKIPEESMNTYNGKDRISYKLYNTLDLESKIEITYSKKDPAISSVNPNFIWGILVLLGSIFIIAGCIFGCYLLLQYVERYNKMQKEGEKVTAVVMKKEVREYTPRDRMTNYSYYILFSIHYHNQIIEDHRMRKFNKSIYNSVEKGDKMDVIVMPDEENNILYVSLTEDKIFQVFM